MTRGSCLCGAVVFEIDGETTEIGMCHCSKCRKVSGVASNATLMTSSDNLRWVSGEDHIMKYAMADGWGAWRCTTCGSPLPKLHGGGGAYWVPAGVLDDDPGVRIAGHIFVGSKAAWDEVGGNGPRLSKGFGSKPAD
ncbi:MAG: GFA family protein [Deltaproteobacteria bacterium]|nr:GFA family protein [Deltaproteobacteria bacterium]MBW2446343.1 GFA family protein [Deltaproteobacteria bacterium]